MAPFVLTARELGDLQSLLQAPTAREPRRAQALLWLAQGFPVEEVADLLGISRQTVYNWARRFQDRDGDEARPRLADAPRSGRPPTALGIIDPLVAEVIDRDPRDLGYRATGWTNGLLRRYLREVHQVSVSRRSVSRALARLAILWKRPRHQLALRPDTWRQSKGGSSAASGAARAPCC
jgi:transposase